VLKEASRLYAASWVRDIGPELRPNDYKKEEENGDNFDGGNNVNKKKEPSTLEDLGISLVVSYAMMFVKRNNAYHGPKKIMMLVME
jgi:hypothetical protein